MITLNQIKASIQPVDFYRHELPEAQFKKHGWTDGGLCPFHSDNKIGSFRVNLITGAYKCFACEASGGDIIAFKMQMTGLSFTDALATLANEWGLK